MAARGRGVVVPGTATKAKSQELKGLRKAALLLITLGDKTASEILRCLTPLDIQRITAEIASIQFVSQDLSVQILEEFNKLLATQEYLTLGGAEYAEKLLEAAFGNDEARRLLSRSLRSRTVRSLDPGDWTKSNPEQLVKLIQDEQPQTMV
jgi:flagellar motor switch protein FliG